MRLPWRIRLLPAPHRRSRDARGQSIVELAVVLPVALTLVGAGLDVGRAFERQVKLQHAVRQVAERVAMTSTSVSSANRAAQQWVCAQLDLPETCTDVRVSTSFSLSSTALGGTSRNPLARATVEASLPFQTLFPYPYLTGDDGRLTLRASSTYEVLQGR